MYYDTYWLEFTLPNGQTRRLRFSMLDGIICETTRDYLRCKWKLTGSWMLAEEAKVLRDYLFDEGLW